MRSACCSRSELLLRPPDTDEMLQRMASSLQAWQRALGAAAAGGDVIDVGGLVASVVPAAADRSILNAAAAPHGAELDSGVLRELAARYRTAGITRWGIWVHEHGLTDAAPLSRAGLVIDSQPTAMAIELEALRAPLAREPVAVQRTDDLSLLARPLAAGYGFPAQFLTSGLPGLLEHSEGWIGWIGDVPVAGLVLVREGDDAGVFMVAADPAARGRGAAGTVLHEALRRARDSGCTTSTLQSSAMGRSLYERLGYAPIGAYLLWESRQSSG